MKSDPRRVVTRGPKEKTPEELEHIRMSFSILINTLVRNGHRFHDVVHEYPIELVNRLYDAAVFAEDNTFYKEAIRDLTTLKSLHQVTTKADASKINKEIQRFLDNINPMTHKLKRQGKTRKTVGGVVKKLAAVMPITEE
jgi:hypothetical protein